ncbi:MAG: mobile mystery protein B [Proteobacteria bacterium]|nr:mobile mystery protein B [Pseudomonadota bacterium]
MTDPLTEEDEGSTPLTEEEKADLIPSYITLRSELNEAEQRNIIEAEEWAFKKERNVLSEDFLKELHKRMFGKVWRWAGKFRKSERNIGVEVYHISADLRQLIDDCRYWLDHNTYEPDEIAARFAHRLAHIHPFPNGNGRHSRTTADLLLVTLGQERFSWGRANLVNVGEVRAQYIAALHAADRHDYAPLFEFVRS